jgi:uncharacterized membrane protein YqjE
MWAEYRKKFLFTQILIIAMLVMLRFSQNYAWPAMGFAFLVLQFFGIMGIRWSMRMKRKLEAEQPMLRR